MGAILMSHPYYYCEDRLADKFLATFAYQIYDVGCAMRNKLRRNVRKSIWRKKIANYIGVADLTDADVYSSLINGNVWLFSQKKSGTTRFCNTLAFYRAIRNGQSDYSFDNLAKFGVLRSVHTNFGDVGKSLHAASSYGVKAVIHSHTYWDAKPRHLILQSRDVFDYVVSAYHFLYKNRVGSRDIEVDAVLGEIVRVFIKQHHNQIRAASQAEDVSVLYYEDVQGDPLTTYSDVLGRIEPNFDPAVLELAISAASAEKLGSFEIERGHAAVAAEGTLTKKHFIRSGKIGEGREFLSESQIELVKQLCKDAQVSIDGRFKNLQ